MRLLKLKYNDKKLENITPGTSLYEISKLVQKDFKYEIIGAKFNNQMADLSKCVNESGDVCFYDISSSIGNRIYSRSLEFLVIAAAKRVLPKGADVLINYSVYNGLYCEVSCEKVSKKQILSIEDAMRDIVQENKPFIRLVVSRFDAIKYFKRNGQLDKVSNLSYIGNSTINLHKLGNIYDYFFGPLVYSTGQLDKFKITVLDSSSFVVNYPSLARPSIVSPYVHHEKLFEKFKEYEEWGRLVNIDMVSDLNELGARGKYDDAIRLFETYYEAQLTHAADSIFKKRKKIKVVLISGPSSSGKTTSTKKLSLYLRAKGLRPHQISLDDYFVDREKTPLDENGEYDYANIKATDVSLFNTHIKKLLNGEKVSLPRYDFVLGKKVFDGKVLQLMENDILLIEGIHTLNDKLTKYIDRDSKYKILITPIMQMKIDNHNRVRTNDVRKLRRIVRDSRFRGTGAEATLKIWHNVVKEANENIFPFQDDVDFVINSALSYEIGVLRIFAEPLLYGIKPNSPVYPEALRLINLLRQFLPISSESVPKDSILREFIGEGVFNE